MYRLASTTLVVLLMAMLTAGATTRTVNLVPATQPHRQLHGKSISQASISQPFLLALIIHVASLNQPSTAGDVIIVVKSAITQQRSVIIQPPYQSEADLL